MSRKPARHPSLARRRGGRVPLAGRNSAARFNPAEQSDKPHADSYAAPAGHRTSDRSRPSARPSPLNPPGQLGGSCFEPQGPGIDPPPVGRLAGTIAQETRPAAGSHSDIAQPGTIGTYCSRQPAPPGAPRRQCRRRAGERGHAMKQLFTCTVVHTGDGPMAYLDGELDMSTAGCLRATDPVGERRSTHRGGPFGAPFHRNRRGARPCRAAAARRHGWRIAVVGQAACNRVASARDRRHAKPLPHRRRGRPTPTAVTG
jgi:hypothetical protein